MLEVLKLSSPLMTTLDDDKCPYYRSWFIVMTMMSSLYEKHGQLNLSLQGNAESANSASVIIVGDFKLPTLNWSPDESVLNCTGGSTENNEFCVLMKDNFLQQFIRGPTHIAGNKLDFLLSNSPEIIDNISTFTPVECKFPSDHYLVNFSLRLNFKRVMR